MVERSSEEVTPLKIHNVEMISIHCGAHRLALATSLAADSITFLKWFDSSFVLKNSGSGSWFAIGASLREPHIDENNVRNPYISLRYVRRPSAARYTQCTADAYISTGSTTSEVLAS